ncbi:hypothetical protein D9M71_464480 [compost metagenome]
MRLGRVFEHQQTVLGGNLVDCLHVCNLPIQVHRQDDAGFVGDRLANEGCIDIERCSVRLDEYRLQPTGGDSQDARNVGIGRDDDFITRLHPPQLLPGGQGQRQRIEAVGHTNAMIGTAISGKVAFKAGQGATADVPAGVDDIGARLQQLFAVLFIDGLQIQEINHALAPLLFLPDYPLPRSNQVHPWSRRHQHLPWHVDQS